MISVIEFGRRHFHEIRGRHWCIYRDWLGLRKGADREWFGLVNNAGIAVPGPLLYLKIDDFRSSDLGQLNGPVDRDAGFRAAAWRRPIAQRCAGVS
jgi:hypothetical protein